MIKADEAFGWVILMRGDYAFPLKDKRGHVRFFSTYDSTKKTRKPGDVAAPVTQACVAEWGWVLDREADR